MLETPDRTFTLVAPLRPHAFLGAAAQVCLELHRALLATFGYISKQKG